jgi:hypothetical protein
MLGSQGPNMDLSELGEGRKFDLLAHTFRALGVDPTTSQQDLLSALKQAAQTASMTDLTSIRDALFNPHRRLFYELAYPLDCVRSEIDAYYAALGANVATRELLRFADRLWPLARANFLAHVASHRPASGEHLFELVRSHTAVDPTDIHIRLRTARAAAGIPAPSFLSVSQGLSELRKAHLNAALLGYHAAQDAAVPMFECARRALASEEGDCSKALGRLLRSYKHAIDQARTEACQRMERACAAVSVEPNDASSIREMSDAAEVWTSLCRPLLAWNAKQRERQLSFDTPVAPLRALVRELCERRQFQAAVKVKAATRDMFAEVPTTLDQLAEDARLLAAMSAYRSMDQLQKLIHEADMDASLLIPALATSGFGQTSTGPARRFWQAFVDATSTSPEPSSWRLMHDFTVRLSNRPEAAAAVVALIDGLIRYGERTSLPPKMLGELRDNLAFMHSFIGAEPAPDEMRARPSTREKGARLAALSAGLARLFAKKPRRLSPSGKGHWGKPAVGVGLITTVALCAYAACLGFDRVPFWLSETSAAAPLDAQTVPQVGTGQHFALEGVRYCRYQQERIGFIKKWIKGTDDARTYNLLIVDYNSRCSDFFYKDEDRKLVEAEVKAKQDVLEADARQIVSARSGPGSEVSSKN